MEMDDQVKRWSVTYTKDLKQKRKVYQDGVLALYTATRKAKLYDDCGNVLEVKILKNDDIVKSGETITFHSHLVDVGDCEGDIQPSVNASVGKRVNKVSLNVRVPPMKKFRSPVCAGNSEVKVEKNEVPPTDISVPQQLIRQFKKAEIKKYTARRSSPVLSDSSVTEWVATYTTQVTKKAKTYHDGYVRLESCGIHGRKVLLYDTSRKLLNNRFLTSDEQIQTGDSLSFEDHIVVIGEAEVNKRPKLNFEVDRKSLHSIQEHRKSLRHKNIYKEGAIGASDKDCANPSTLKPQHSDDKTTDIPISEWEVLYTTQLTQKAKKYQDGSLCLKNCGSQGRKVMLYDTSGRLLETRFLNKEDLVGAGESLSLAGHLVDVGEPIAKAMKNEKPRIERKDVKGKNEMEKVSGPQGFLQSYNMMVLDKDVTKSCFEDRNFTVDISQSDEKGSSKTCPEIQPLRDVDGILSILKGSFGKERPSVRRNPSSVEQHLKNLEKEKMPPHTERSDAVLKMDGDFSKTFDEGQDEHMNPTSLPEGEIYNQLGPLHRTGLECCTVHTITSEALQATSTGERQIVNSAEKLDVMEVAENSSFPQPISNALEEICVAKTSNGSHAIAEDNHINSSSTEIQTSISSLFHEYIEDNNLKKEVGHESWQSDEASKYSVLDSFQAVTKSTGDIDEFPSFNLGF